MVWIAFIVCGGALTYFSYYLCKEGVILSERAHISEGIIGMIFLAIATSFPEISTAATSVYFLDQVGLGYSDIIGSVLVNFMILLGVDYYSGKGRVLTEISRTNRLTGVFVAVFVSIVLGAAVIRSRGYALPSLMGIGVENLVIVLAYVAALRWLKDAENVPHDPAANKEPKWEIWSKFIVLLAIVMVLGALMAKVGEQLVLTTGLSQTFTGALLLGFATSLPEIIVSAAALRAGSLNMSVGNILGSNLFDVCIIPLLDALHRAPILGTLTKGQILVTGIALLMSVVFVAGSFIKRRTNTRLNWDTGAIFAIGFAGFVIVYFVR